MEEKSAGKGKGPSEGLTLEVSLKLETEESLPVELGQTLCNLEAQWKVCLFFLQFMRVFNNKVSCFPFAGTRVMQPDRTTYTTVKTKEK